jgi:hypothetical protein
MTLNKIETKAVKFIALDTNLNSNTKSITLLEVLDQNNINTKLVNTVKVRLALKQIENSY